MNIFSEKIQNPHILLFLLSLDKNIDESERKLKKINYLTRTRMFDEILKGANQLDGMVYPTLNAKIQIARKKNEDQKKSLGAESVNNLIKQAQDKLKQDDPNFQEIDNLHDRIFKIAKILFEEGQYQKSLQILEQIEKQELKEELWLKSTWAILYCQIILKKQSSLKTIEALKKKIEDIESQEISFYLKEKKDTTKIMKKYYAQKEQFLILSTLVFFSSARDDDLQKFVDFSTSQKSYFSVVQITYPEAIRYITVAFALNKTLQTNRNFDLFKLVEVVNRKIIKYRDSFVDFISALYIDFDFESISQKVQIIKQEIQKDILLAPYLTRIIEGLHFMYFKVACKVYQKISFQQISKFTGKSNLEAEIWILGYIRSNDIEAKIDSINKVLINHKNKQSNYEKYMDVLPNISTFVNTLSRAINNQ